MSSDDAQPEPDLRVASTDGPGTDADADADTDAEPDADGIDPALQPVIDGLIDRGVVDADDPPSTADELADAITRDRNKRKTVGFKTTPEIHEQLNAHPESNSKLINRYLAQVFGGGDPIDALERSDREELREIKRKNAADRAEIERLETKIEERNERADDLRERLDGDYYDDLREIQQRDVEQAWERAYDRLAEGHVLFPDHTVTEQLADALNCTPEQAIARAKQRWPQIPEVAFRDPIDHDVSDWHGLTDDGEVKESPNDDGEKGPEYWENRYS